MDVGPEMEDLPDEGARELLGHVAREEPVGDGAALDDLRLEHLVDDDAEELRVLAPHVVDLTQQAHLRLLVVAQRLRPIVPALPSSMRKPQGCVKFG